MKMETTGKVPLDECEIGAFYIVVSNNQKIPALYCGNDRFIKVIPSHYKGHDLLAERHIDSKQGVGEIIPLRRICYKPQNILCETTLGLHCETCGEPISVEWKHQKKYSSGHKPIAVWKQNTSLIELLLELQSEIS